MDKLWKHQEEALETIKGLPGAMLYMGLGVGKSRVIVEHIHRQNLQKILILAPLSVLFAWRLQFETHSPDMPAVVILNKGSIAKRLEEAKRAVRGKKKVVLVLNYDAVWREPFGSWAIKQKFDLLVLDEVQRLKAPGGKSSRYCQRLGRSAFQRVGLSGTPFANGPVDIYGQYRAIDPSVFGTSFVRFRNRYCNMGGFQGYQIVSYRNQTEMNRKFYSIAHRADRDVLDLPDVKHVQIPIELSPKVRKIYVEIENEFIAGVADGTVSVSNALVKLLRLQQVTSGAVKLDDEEKVTVLHSLKKDALSDLMEALDKDEPMVVFCRFRSDLEAVHAAAKKNKRTSGELSGSRHELEGFQDGNYNVIAVQISSGAEGISLVRARHCVYFSLGFSLAQYTQSLARIHRPGQDYAVTYHHLVVQHSVDEKVYRALNSKKKVIDEILDMYRRP